jgi:hypothetical protein
MKLLIVSMACLFSINAFAGDAGYFSRTCISSSQRTVFTILDDYTQNAPIYTLIVDGVPAVYNLTDKSIDVIGDDGILTISKDGSNVFKMDFNAETGEMAVTVYKDPRVGTIAEHGITNSPMTVQLKCTDYWPAP